MKSYQSFRRLPCRDTKIRSDIKVNDSRQCTKACIRIEQRVCFAFFQFCLAGFQLNLSVRLK